MRYILVIIILSTTFLFTQDKEWSPKSFDSLEVDDDMNFDPDDENIFEYSKGYFPHPVSFNFNIGVIGHFGVTDDLAYNILPSGLVKTNNTYTGHYSEENDYLDFMEKFSNDEEDTYLTNDVYSVGLDLKLAPAWSLPLLFRTSGIITWNTGLLYSLDRSKKYYDFEEGAKNYLEIGVIYLNEVNFELNPAFIIPIYGAFINRTPNLNSFYYLYMGANITKVLSSETTQYLQIGDAKEKLRFENGYDTTRLASEIRLNTLNPLRYGIEWGLGMETEFLNFGLVIELRHTIPITSVLKDTAWHQHKFSVNYIIYLGGLFK